MALQDHSIIRLMTQLPHIVVYHDHSKILPHQESFHGVLLFADVSGFTALTERYSVKLKSGTEELTKTLNRFFGYLVQLIIDHDGDVLKYAGDALLAVWKSNSFKSLGKSIIQAVRCSLKIQNSYSEWVTDVGVKFKVKIGLASGEVSLIFVGNNQFRHYVAVGEAVNLVTRAETFCESGDVVLSQSLFKFLEGLNSLEVSFIPNNINFAKIVDCGDYQLDRELKALKYSYTYSRTTTATTVKKKRNCLKQSNSKNLNNSTNTLLKYEEKSYIINQNSLNKAKFDVQTCLLSKPDRVRIEVADNELINGKDLEEKWRCLSLTVSIGVTTGSTFCGVVGHLHRQEYTVMGRKVNMAARLMVQYPGKVCCDSETFHYSKLPILHFSILKVGKRTERHIKRREKELSFLLAEVEYLNKMGNARENIIVVEGDLGYGKTSLLHTFIEKVISLWDTKTTIITYFNEYNDKGKLNSLESILTQLLGIKLDSDRKIKEDKLRQLKERDNLECICLLNDYLNTKILQSEKLLLKSSKERESVLYQLILLLVEKLVNEDTFLLHIIDDANGLDREFWKVINIFKLAKRCLTILFMKTSSEMCDEAIELLQSNGIKKITLKPLSSEHIVQLSKVLLSCDALSEKFEKHIVKKSNGIPKWIEQILESENINTEEEKPKQDNKRICIIINEHLLGQIPESIQVHVQAQLDRLNQAEEIFIKYAAVCGRTFERFLLQTIAEKFLSDYTAKFQRIIQNLTENEFFCCANFPEEASFNPKLCYCYPERGPLKSTSTCPCLTIKFKSDIVQQAAYEMVLESLRRKIHKEIVFYFEKSDKKCPACDKSSRFSYEKDSYITTPLANNKLSVLTSDEEAQNQMNDTKDRLSLLRNSYSGKCQCVDIVRRTCEKLAYHSKRAKLIERALYYSLQTAKLLINIHHDKLDYHLRNVKRMVKSLSNERTAFSTKWDGELKNVNLNGIKANVEYILGETKYSEGRWSDAAIYAERALQLLGENITNRRFYSWIVCIVEVVKQFIHTKKPSTYFSSSPNKILIVRCLSLLLYSRKFIHKGHLMIGDVLKLVNMAETTGNAYELAKAYTLFASVLESYNLKNLSLNYEHRASLLISDPNLTKSGVAQVCCSILNSELKRGSLESAQDAGFLSHRLSTDLRDNFLYLATLPNLMTSLLMAKCFGKISEILAEFNDISLDLSICMKWELVTFAGILNENIENLTRITNDLLDRRNGELSFYLASANAL
ncbi:DgyrCDS8863 [Dimorphilus gyrociliatus]|uniref:DgyrCDS8863 n=1 Tax=Dimorphilus gyrociliatus TaxID=2664684 RepID=A0A7I8VXM3_9ANNE|nr:DgyrCDS8863 [Dimorphilus gyrociliatus]